MSRLRHPVIATALVAVTAVAGCSSTGTPTTGASGSAITSTTASVAASASTAADTATGTAAGTSGSESATAAGSVFDSSTVHTIAIDVDSSALTTMLQTYVDSGDKKWIKATVTIDGTKFSDVGIKLKGNSSLRGVTTTSQPQSLPWRIRLDKYVDGQNIDGYSDFTVRENASTTSLNEAVALDLLGDAGLATEHEIETRFSVNGSAAVLRLTIQNLDETWVKQNFPKAGADSVLYKSDADGDWSWRGTGGDYSSSFDIEAGPDDYTPLIELLDLLHNGTKAEITEKLPKLVDLDSFATYLAFEDLVDNFDDISGPGNNSYLFWDSATKKFTVVAWDHNLAFGASPGGTGGGQQGGGQPGGGQRPGGDENQGGGGQFPGGGNGSGNGNGNGSGNGNDDGGRGNGPGGGRAGKDNPLVDAFNANATWKAMYTKAQSTLKASLITSGRLDDSVTAWVKVLTDDASGLVSASTISSDAAKIRAYGDK